MTTYADNEQTLIRCDPFDPNRCQTTGQQGQCPFKAEEGKKYCRRHGSTANHSPELRRYQIAKFQEKIGRQIDHPQIKDLSEEIAILRMMIETKLNLCEDDIKLSMYSDTIGKLVGQVTDAVSKWHKIQLQTNAVMDRTQALEFIFSITAIISRHVTDQGALQEISNEMILDLQRRTDYTLRVPKQVDSKAV